MTSGPVVAMELMRSNAISRWRELIGYCDIAKYCPNYQCTYYHRIIENTFQVLLIVRRQDRKLLRVFELNMEPVMYFSVNIIPYIFYENAVMLHHHGICWYTMQYIIIAIATCVIL